jgi:hypothetical protein
MSPLRSESSSAAPARPVFATFGALITVWNGASSERIDRAGDSDRGGERRKPDLKRW